MNWNSSLPDISPLWQYTKGKGIKVAILDSGADFSHPVLKQRIKEYEDFTDSVTRLGGGKGSKHHQYLPRK
jgi:membrane-anchored mycosin MYCP